MSSLLEGTTLLCGLGLLYVGYQLQKLVQQTTEINQTMNRVQDMGSRLMRLGSDTFSDCCGGSCQDRTSTPLATAAMQLLRLVGK